MSQATRILGVDPGTRVVGYGVVDAEGSRVRIVEAGVIAPPAKDPLERRLARIAAELAALIDRLRPAAAAVEDVFVQRDPRAALAVGQGRGVVLSVLGARALTVASYPPARIKRAVAGNGRAGKEQVARMVGAILGLATPPQPLDATDALAAALAHALALKTQHLSGK